MTTATKITRAAHSAAALITARFAQDIMGIERLQPNEVARIIDEATGLPDLLEACELAKTALEAIDDKQAFVIGTGVIVPAREAVRAAIAKATP